MRKHSLTALAAMVLLFAGCGDDGKLPGQPNKKDRFVRPSDVSSFAKLYQQNCVGCHGENGTFGAAPPLNDAIFLAIVPDKALLDVISAGRKGTEMPAFLKDNGGTLTAEQVKILATGIRKEWGKTPPANAKELPAYEPAGKGDAAQGKKVFAMACAGCHGAEGKGGVAGGAINDAVFLALTSDLALRRLIITGRPDLDMPSSMVFGTKERPEMKAPLTTANVDDLMALIAGWRK